MTAQKQPASAVTGRPAPAAATTARKPWIKKTPVEVVLEQITKQETKVQDMEKELNREKRELQKLLEARKVLEAK